MIANGNAGKNRNVKKPILNLKSTVRNRAKHLGLNYSNQATKEYLNGNLHA